MANNFSASFEEVWALEQQEVFYKENVSMKVANISFNSTLKTGDTLHRTYRSVNKPYAYVRGTAITVDDKTDTDETLSVNKQYASRLYVDDFDAIQDKYDAAAKYGYDNGIFLANQVDADVLGEALNAASTVDDGDLGNTSGDGIQLDSGNVLKVVALAKTKLKKQNVPLTNLQAVISPEFEQALIEYGAGRDTQMGDKMNDNGYIMDFYQFKLYGSNQLTGTALLSMSVNPTNGDTIVISAGGQSQTFTFVSSIGTTAGNVLIAGAVDGTRANLEALINAPGTTTANGVALTGENLKLFQNQITAVNNNTSDTLALTAKGVNVVTVTSTFTSGSNSWTASKRIQHNLFMAGKNPTLVVQSMPKVQFVEAQDMLGKYIKNGVLYGVKTFNDDSKRMVDVKIRSDLYT